MKSDAAILLIETAQGDTVAVRFPSVEAARRWEDLHEGTLVARGCARLVTTGEALRLAGVSS